MSAFGIPTSLDEITVHCPNIVLQGKHASTEIIGFEREDIGCCVRTRKSHFST